MVQGPPRVFNPCPILIPIPGTRPCVISPQSPSYFGGCRHIASRGVMRLSPYPFTPFSLRLPAITGCPTPPKKSKKYRATVSSRRAGSHGQYLCFAYPGSPVLVLMVTARSFARTNCAVASLPLAGLVSLIPAARRIGPRARGKHRNVPLDLLLVTVPALPLLW